MAFETLRKRCLTRLTAPPEILFALTRHWTLLVICLGIGTALMVSKVSTDPVVYEGRATLALNSGESIIVDQDRRGNEREDASRFFSSRVDMLLSGSVLRKLVLEIRAPNVLLQEQNTEALDYGPIRRAINRAKEKIAEFLAYLEHPVILDVADDLELQKAISSFRRRSKVIPNARTNTVDLRLYGSNRDVLAKEIQAWIDAYTSRLVEMTEESCDIFINSRTRFWLKKEQEARDVLETFKKEKPEVSKSAQDLLLLQISRLEDRREDLLRERDFPNVKVAAPDEPHSTDPELKSLQAKKQELENKVIEALAEYEETSDKVRSIRQSLALVEAKISGFDAAGVADPEQRRLQIEEQIGKLTAAIGEARKRHTAMGTLLDQLQNLEFEHKQAQKTHQDYKLMMTEEIDRNDLKRNVQVQVADRPTVDWRPYNAYPHRQVLYGSVGGLVLGIVIALLLEVLSGKVRFKNDVYAEFGVPVVGVIPRR